MRFIHRPLPLILAAASLSCSSDPMTSYCESLCSWGTSCAEGEREIDATLYDDCLAATEAVDSSCADATSGEQNAAAAKALETCTEAVDEQAAAGECGAFTGTIDELKLGTAPTSCASQGQDGFGTARDAVTETNDQLCNRFYETFCDAAAECMIEQHLGGDLPDEVTEALGGTPSELCLEQVDAQSQSCVDDQLYLPEEDLTEVNTARQGARECLRDFDTITCDQILSGDMPEFCAASFTSTEDATSLASVIFDLASEVAGLAR